MKKIFHKVFSFHRKHPSLSLFLNGSLAIVFGFLQIHNQGPLMLPAFTTAAFGVSSIFLLFSKFGPLPSFLCDRTWYVLKRENPEADEEDLEVVYKEIFLKRAAFSTLVAIPLAIAAIVVLLVTLLITCF